MKETRIFCFVNVSLQKNKFSLLLPHEILESEQYWLNVLVPNFVGKSW